MKRLLATLCLIVLSSLPAAADTLIQTRTTSGGDQPNDQMDMLADAYTDGTQVQVHFRESSNPWMKQGMYLFSPDAGETLYLVDPQEQTYSEWDLEAMLRLVGGVLRGLGPMLKFEIRDPAVELVSEGPGPSTLGMATREYSFQRSYTMLVRVMGIKNQQSIEEATKVVTTTELPDIGIAVWLRKESPKTGNDELDKLVETTWQRTEGVVLAWRTDSVVTNKKGKQQRSWSEFEALKIDRGSSGPPNGYGFPESYTRVSMMPTEEELAGAQGEEQDEQGKKKGRLGGLFKRDG